MGARRKVPDAELPAIREWFRIWTAIPRPRDMARRYHVNVETIRHIGHGRTYKRVQA